MSSGVHFLTLVCTFIVVSWFAYSANAFDVETLPDHTRMSEIRFGAVSGLNQTWEKDGKLYDLGEARSVTFDATTLARVNDRARALVQALDYFGNHDLGEKIQLGTLNVQTMPQIQYMAPVFAIGLDEKWTFGFGIPIVRYKNALSLSASNSNVEFYRQQFQGISHQLDEALSVDLVMEAQKVIAEKGYRPLENRDQTFIGDIQLVLLHRLAALGAWRLLHQMTFVLPTGPKDDPDDLMALSVFGRTVIGNTMVAARLIARGLTFLPYAGVDVAMPDKVTKRVPKDENDSLPDQDSRQEMSRFVAPTLKAGGELKWLVGDRWEINYAVDASAKGIDHFSGSGRTDLLEKDTDSEVFRVRGGFGYSTIEDYKLKKSSAPGRVALEVTDTVAGRNIERQLKTELSATLFF